jgi:hypothetical protein
MCFSGRLKHPTDFQRLRNILQAVTARAASIDSPDGSANTHQNLSWPVRHQHYIKETLDKDLRYPGKAGRDEFAI